MRKTLLCTLPALSFLLFTSTLLSQPFTLVRDINLGSTYDPPRPSDLTEVGGLLFFKINKGTMAGLWKTDGTSAGTVMVKALSAGETIETLAEANNVLFFVINNTATSITSLWKSDGTAGGSVIVQTWANLRLFYPTTANGVLYFTVTNQSTNPSELWKSDGTAAGTTLLKSASFIENLINVNGTLFFTAAEATVPYHRLWKSNGTVAGTVLVKDISAGAGNPYFASFFNANGTLFFTANDGVNGEELWKSNGTAGGTIMIKNIEPGSAGSNIRSFTIANGTVYFFATTTANGYSLWKSDGTSDGTERITSFTGEADYLTNVNGKLFFMGADDIHGVELWKSDGTEAGTVMVKDINPGLDPNFSNSSYPGSLFDANGILYFTASSRTGTAIWKSDGTDAGTVLVKDNFQGLLYPSLIIQFVMANGIVYFPAFEQLYGSELWKTDGTTGGTVVVKNIVPSADSSPKKFVAANGLVYFSALNYVNSPGPSQGRDIFQTDGTFSGTIRAEGINGRFHSEPLDWANHNGELFISGTSGHSNNFDGHELYKISANGAKVVRVKNISPSTGSYPHNFQSVGQFLYFSANDAITGFELWKTDGTEEGTVMVKDINPHAESNYGDSNPENLVNANGTLFFTAYSGGNGIELWKSDGTDAGTVLVKNINLYADSKPLFLTHVNGVVYFIADDGINGVELWKSNGTEAGTILVKNIKASGSSSPAFLTNVNGTLFFAADNGINGVELWKTDGTTVGTVLVKDIRLGNASSTPASIINLNGTAYFSADNGTNGRELWKSNGTSTGTVLAADVWPDENGSNPTVLTKIGNNLLFAANNGINGNEVWVYNANGPRMMSDIEPGPGSSDPTELFEYGSKVLAAASSSIVGSELWIANIPSDIPIGPDATITAAGPLTICTGQSVQLKANTGSGFTYQWKKAGVNIAGATQSNYTATLAGYYTVVVTDASGASATSEVTIVTLVSTPLPTITAAGPLTFCAGKNVLLKANTGAGYTYQWKKGGVNIIGATFANHTATAAGIYSVVVTNASGCSATSAATSVMVNAIPLAKITAGGPLTFCAGKSVLLKAYAVAGYIYQWKKGGVNIVGATLANHTATAAGIYSVVVTNASGCSVTSAATTVIVNAVPIARITAGGPLTFCAGKSVLLKAYAVAGYSYQWKKGGVNIAGATLSNYTATVAGLYTVVVTNAAGCSVTSAATIVIVNAVPIARITAGGPLTFCTGKTVLLKAYTGAGYTYQWKKSGVNLISATLSNYTATASGVYTVVVMNASGCSATSAATTVVVNSLPNGTITAAGPLTFCAGKSVLLKAYAATGYSYQWKKSGINIMGAILSNYTAAVSGVYTVVVTNAAGCSITSAGTIVLVNPVPVATITAAGPLIFCAGNSVLLKANTGAGYTYQWKKSGVNIMGATLSNYTATGTGIYTVAVTNVVGCVTTSAGINVTVNALPLASITPRGPITLPAGGNIVLKATTGTGYTFQWYKDGVIINGALSNTYAATVAGNYTVLIANSNSCQAVSQPVQVSVSPAAVITKGAPSLRQAEKDQINPEPVIKVFPNPLHQGEYLNFEWNISNADKSIQVTVFDISGRKIESRFLDGAGKKLRIKGVSGIYMVEIRWGKNERKIFQIIKI